MADAEAMAGEVVKLMKAALSPVIARIGKLELTLNALPMGEMGAPGPQGEKGEPGPPGEIPVDLRDRLVALEATVHAAPPVDDEDLAAHFTGLLTKELTDLTPLATPMRKRVTKNAAGDFLITEEPA